MGEELLYCHKTKYLWYFKWIEDWSLGMKLNWIQSARDGQTLTTVPVNHYFFGRAKPSFMLVRVGSVLHMDYVDDVVVFMMCWCMCM